MKRKSAGNASTVDPTKRKSGFSSFPFPERLGPPGAALPGGLISHVLQCHSTPICA
ncbi:ER degradation-enhancing alpha-mannosidase-like 1 [Anopheles sinensis]|uniref:ER degradation-enhancing alpha-mannosidase-like 1 n=1 Tax=Anopheles sinensis TaxID=74873 RepID=A0A084W685_ANOSI|nr:ER degradation-enhancing alpha-mannosidase-like 1 [Anopheles sinensis]